MKREDWLILLLGLKSSQATPKLDPVRLQKGMFLLGQEGGLAEDEVYQFEPLHYGPYSRELRRDVERLARQGLVAKEGVPGYTWKEYRLSADGMAQARELLADAPRPQLIKLFQIKKEITEASFATLLRNVYDKYPDYATKSVFAR